MHPVGKNRWFVPWLYSQKHPSNFQSHSAFFSTCSHSIWWYYFEISFKTICFLWNVHGESAIFLNFMAGFAEIYPFHWLLSENWNRLKCYNNSVLLEALRTLLRKRKESATKVYHHSHIGHSYLNILKKPGTISGYNLWLIFFFAYCVIILRWSKIEDTLLPSVCNPFSGYLGEEAAEQVNLQVRKLILFHVNTHFFIK